MKNRFIKYIKRIVKLIRLDEMQVLPAHLAFYLVLMIVPVCSLIGLLGSNLNLNELLNVLKNNVPEAVLSLIESAFSSKTSNYNVFLFFIFSLWICSNGTKAIIISSNYLFKIKENDTVKIRLKAISMILVLFILLGFILVVPVFGDFIVQILTSYFKETGRFVITNIYNFLKYPISIFLMFFLLKILYTMASTEKIKSKYMNNGAWFTSISWLLLSRFYSYHLNNYSNYNVYYGSLSNILILLVWTYLLAYIFTIGLSLNADYYLMSKSENDKNNYKY